MSDGTYVSDVKAWQALAKKRNAGTDFAEIKANDGKVASIAKAVNENNDYKLLGPNSNSAAQAVGDRAQGSNVPTPDKFDTPVGVEDKKKITFDEKKIQDDENAGRHRENVPPTPP
jgi:hypothetical protein